jgi:hypothetical protein
LAEPAHEDETRRATQWTRPAVAGIARATKVAVLVSLAAALGTEVACTGAIRPDLAALVVVSFSVACVLGTWWPDSIACVLVWIYLTPALVVMAWVNDSVAYRTIWMAALFGALLPASLRQGWRLPASWTVPLVGWALAAAMTWPIIAARELNFGAQSWAQLSSPISLIGLPASTAISATADTAAMLLIGIVWLDWLFGMFAGDVARFEHLVMAPLLASGALACSVAVYQLLFDMTFLNAGFGNFGRAGGAMLDANAFGIAAAFCACGYVAWLRRDHPARTMFACAGLAVAIVGLWASGSRTALIAGLLAFVPLLVLAFRRRVFSSGKAVPRRLVGAALTLFIAGVLVLAFLSNAGPVRRLRWIIPVTSVESLNVFALDMWTRFGYGKAAVRMIGEHPWFGVGIGSFPILVGDYPFSHLGGPLVPDNAQNWVRHQLAELGVVGCLGWVAWVAMLAATTASWRAHATSSFRTAVTGGALVGVIVISQVGMPTTNLAVAITFWTFLFWYLLLTYPPWVWKPATSETRPAPWLVMVVLVLLFTGGTLHSAVTTLRVPMRARDAGWAYSYGFLAPEPDGKGGEFRWTIQNAAAVVPAPKRVVKVTVWTGSPDAASRPLHARVWHDDRPVIDAVLADATPVDAYVEIDRDPPWFMVRTWIDRELDASEPREHGLAVEWTFLDALPSNSARDSGR